jgi:succinate dehydrogenase / fumarate reductase cytochrome b subunit
MSEAVNKNRKRFGVMTFADIRHYALPLPAYLSILHRIGGVFIFVLLPFLIYLLDKSLVSELSFKELTGFTSGWFVKLIILGLSWSYLHHFCAGIRHMFMDFHVGLDKSAARKSTVIVFIVSLVLTAGVAWKLFGASNG